MIRIAKSKKKMVGAVLISVIVVSAGFGVAFAVNTGKIKSMYNEQVDTLKSEMEKNQVVTYVALCDVAAGSELKKSNVELQTVYLEGGDSSSLITEKDLGKIVNCDIKGGQPVYQSMMGSALAFSLRETELACLTLSSNLKKEDLIDVRIMYPNGENYIVLSKVCLQNLEKSSNDCYLWLAEDQIMTVSSAIVDTYLHEGAILYTTRYIEDGQDETTPNYIPTKHCITAMANDENIVEKAKAKLNASAREALETRLKEQAEKKNVNLKEILPGSSASDDSADDSSGGTEEDVIEEESEEEVEYGD